MPDDAGAALWWLPVGAGGRVVVHTSGWWEWYRAWREHRRPAPLFHAALEVTAGDTRYVIEMAPAWGGPAGPRGVPQSKQGLGSIFRLVADQTPSRRLSPHHLPIGGIVVHQQHP